MTRTLPLAALALFAATASAAPRVERLLPLSEKDTFSTRETGCEFGFRQARQTYLLMIGRDFMIRTAPGKAGLKTCRITDRQYGGFGDGRMSIACAGRTLSVRRTGAVVTNPEADSADGPAILTVRQRGASRTIRGNWGSAC